MSNGVLRLPLLALVTVYALVIAHTTSRADTSVPAEVVMKLAPQDTDIILRADIQVLDALIHRMDSFPPFADIVNMVKKLRDGLGLPGAEKLDIRIVYTFHVRNSDQQLVVLELKKRPRWLKEPPRAYRQKLALVELDGHTFLLFSKTDGLANASSVASTMSRLSRPLLQRVRALGAKQLWATMVLTPQRRQRIREIAGAPGTQMEPEIADLQLIDCILSRVGEVGVDFELLLHYDSHETAVKHFALLPRSLPFKQPGRTVALPADQPSAIKVVQIDIPFKEFRHFFSQF